MEKETLYFGWEDGPAVVNPTEAGYRGYFISPGGSDWTLAMPSQVADFFVDGSEMSKAAFEKTFGIIGADLPELPAVT